MSQRVNVEEVFKREDGSFTGLSSGKEYMKSEVECIGPFHWSKPAHGADVVEYENEGCDDQDKDYKSSGAKK